MSLYKELNFKDLIFVKLNKNFFDLKKYRYTIYN